MIQNPLIRRFQYSQLRPRQAWIYLTIYVAIVALLVIINAGYYHLNKGTLHSNLRTLADMYRNLFGQFLGLQVLILWLWTPCNTASAVSAEVVQKSYDFFRMLPLSACQKTVGVVIGRNLLPLLIAAINVVLMTGFGYAAGLSINIQTQILLVLVSVAVPLNLASLLLSRRSTGAGHRSSSPLIFLLLAIGIIPYLFIPLCSETRLFSELGSKTICFFALRCPALLLVATVALYFGAWAFLGSIRRFNCEGEPIFSRVGACLFVAGFSVLTMGLCWPLTHGLDIDTKGMFWIISFVPLLFVPFGAINDFNDYLERLGRGSTDNHSSRKIMIGASNLSLALALLAIWAGFAVLHGFLAEFSQSLTFRIIFMHFSFYALLFLVLELFVVYQPVNSKIGILVGFFIILDFILPLILGAIFNLDVLLRFSLFNLWKDICDKQIIWNMSVQTWPFMVNFVFCVPVIWLVIVRYRVAMAAWNRRTDEIPGPTTKPV